MNILVTGGAGFIGSNFLHYMIAKYPNYNFINLDKLTYAGNLENLREIESSPNHTFIKGDICDSSLIEQIINDEKIEAIINFAAETHVDRSISGPAVFVETNVIGTQVLLDAALKNNIKKYYQISTDEVYGELGDEGYFTEKTHIDPSSPYSASKASADLLVQAYNRTYKLPTLISRCSNNYGPRQYPEKLIPLFTTNLLANKKVPVYGSGKNIRDWIHVNDHSSAVDSILHKGKTGEVYNIGGGNEKTNIEITKLILNVLGKGEDMIEYVEDRKGHDFRYAIDCSKMKNELQWEPKIEFNQGLQETINWYKENN